MLIYEPAGKAREYSPLAFNYYNGCDHGCDYCYAPRIRMTTREKYNNVTPRKNVMMMLEKELSKTKIKNQVLLSFMSDPYCKADIKYELTRQILIKLYENEIPVSILTKGGNRILRDLDIIKKYGQNITVGQTLTLNDSSKYEPGAASTEERIEMFKKLKKAGIKTWASFEPVIDTKQSIELIQKTKQVVDVYKVGKLNAYRGLDKNIDWNYFLRKTVELLRSASKDFYIKNDLRKYADGFKLYGNEMEMDEFTLIWR